MIKMRQGAFRMLASPADHWPDFAVEYRHDGLAWGLDLRAKSLDDARRRLRAIAANGEIAGEVEFVVPIRPRLAIHSFGLGVLLGLVIPLVWRAL